MFAIFHLKEIVGGNFGRFKLKHIYAVHSELDISILKNTIPLRAWECGLETCSEEFAYICTLVSGQGGLEGFSGNTKLGNTIPRPQQ